MLNMLHLFLVLFTSVNLFAQQEKYELINQQAAQIESKDPLKAVILTTQNLKAVLSKFKLNLDSSLKETSPLTLAGTTSHPVIKVTLRKCILFFCKNVTLDAEFSLREFQSSCQKSFVISGDLSRSEATLSEVYSRIDTIVCFRPTGASGRLDLETRVIQSPKYSSGFVQNEILKVLKLQSQSIQKAMIESLLANGATRVSLKN